MTNTRQLEHPNENPEHRHEQSDANIRPVLLFGGGLLITTIVILLLMKGLFDYFAFQARQSVARPSPMAGARQPAVSPRLQENPAKDLKEMRTAEETLLNSYGWIDPEAGVVRIPIDRAIELLAERGLPARTQKSTEMGK